jgi:L-threonylcarbamoyladenylate synthase
MAGVEQRKFTPVWKITKATSEASINAAGRVLRRGGVIVYPTETFYGLGGNPMDEAVVHRIFQLKGREMGKPIPLIASDRKAVFSAVAQWPPLADRLADAFWPGPLTLILPARPQLPLLLSAHTKTSAIRVSSNPIAAALASALGGLITATSANRAGEPPSSDSSFIESVLLLQTDGLLDGGALPGDLPSTIVDLTANSPRLVRAGRISWDQIKQKGQIDTA